MSLNTCFLFCFFFLFPFICLECLSSSCLAGDLIFTFSKTHPVSWLQNTAPLEEIMAFFLCTSSKHLDCCNHTVLQLFVYMAPVTIKLWALSPVTGSYSSFYSKYLVALVDAHRYLEMEVIVKLMFSSHLNKGEVVLGAVVSCRSTVQWRCRTPAMPPVTLVLFSLT